MNDWWNDPPEEDDGGTDDYEPDPPNTDKQVPSDFYAKYAFCIHGNNPVHCDACMRESDFLYDANRENRLK